MSTVIDDDCMMSFWEPDDDDWNPWTVIGIVCVVGFLLVFMFS